MNDQQLDTLLKQITNRMSDSSVDQKCIDDVCKMVELTIGKKDYITTLIKHIEKKYYEFWGDESAEFITYPISPKLRIDIGKFKNDNGLEIEDYKRFAVWILENSRRLFKRNMIITDLLSMTAYKLYKEDNVEEKQVIQKKRFNKKMFIKPRRKI